MIWKVASALILLPLPASPVEAQGGASDLEFLHLALDRARRYIASGTIIVDSARSVRADLAKAAASRDGFAFGRSDEAIECRNNVCRARGAFGGVVEILGIERTDKTRTVVTLAIIRAPEESGAVAHTT